jgi:hypothetical protein
LLTPSGEHVRFIPGELARALIDGGIAEVAAGNGRVRSIKLVQTAQTSAVRIGEASAAWATSDPATHQRTTHGGLSCGGCERRHSPVTSLGSAAGTFPPIIHDRPDFVGRSMAARTLRAEGPQQHRNGRYDGLMTVRGLARTDSWRRCQAIPNRATRQVAKVSKLGGSGVATGVATKAISGDAG